MLFQANIVHGCADIACMLLWRRPYVKRSERPWILTSAQRRDDFHKMNVEPTLVANVIPTTLAM